MIQMTEGKQRKIQQNLRSLSFSAILTNGAEYSMLAMLKVK